MHAGDDERAWAESLTRELAISPATLAARATALARDERGACWGERQGDEALAAELLTYQGAQIATARDFFEALHRRNVSLPRIVALLCCLRDALLESAGDRLSVEERATIAASHMELLVLASSTYEQMRGRFDDDARPDAARSPAFGCIVGNSDAIGGVRCSLRSAAADLEPVLIAGETGTGKKLAARALYELSATGPFVAVDCAAIPGERIETELFGPSEGARAGARPGGGGLVGAAGGGILFLDQITEMPIEVQAGLCHLLDGGAGPAERGSKTSVRIVAACNHMPEQAVRSGLLRRDVFCRLAAHRIEIPPVRHRPGDLEALVQHFAVVFAAQGLRRVERFSPEALESMHRYGWPGNVLELREAVEVAVASGSGPVVERAHLPSFVEQLAERTDAAANAKGPTVLASEIPTIANAERALIEKALKATGGNKRRAAKLLGISRHRLYDRLRKWKTSE